MSAASLRDPLALGAPIKFGPGRRAAPLQVAFGRELGVEDLLAAQNSEMVQTLPPLQRLHQRHHQLARVLAQGVSNIEASAIVGYDPQYIANLKDNPAFAELLSYYQAMEAEQYGVARADMHQRLASIGFDSLEHLHQRLEEKPETFTNKELLAIVEATADRTGHGKQSKVQHEHSHSLSPETLARVKANSLGGSSSVAEEDREALLRIAVGRTAAELPEAEEGDWIEGEGHCLREEGDQAPSGEVASGAAELPQVD